MSVLTDLYHELRQQGHAFEVGYEFDYDGERYFIESIDEEDLVFPYETYPVSVRKEMRKSLDKASNEEGDYYSRIYCDLVAEHRVCMSERNLFENRIESLEKEIKKLKEN